MGFAYEFVDVNVAHYNIGKGKLGHTHMTYDRKEPREMNRSERKLVRKVLATYHKPKWMKRTGGIKKWLHYMKHFPLGKI